MNKTRLLCSIVIIFGILLINNVIVMEVAYTHPPAKYISTEELDLLRPIHVSTAAQQLPKKGGLFCWVQTSSKYHSTRAVAINETWLKRCDHGQLFTNSRFEDERIPYSTVFAGIDDVYRHLFYKTRFAFHYIWRYVSKDFDWYLKADDDTYVIVENLRHYLATLNPNKPYYIGYEVKSFMQNGNNGGGAGYVFSRKALELFDEKLYGNSTLCPYDKNEDVAIGRCLANIGIFPTDSRNENGQNRFNAFSPLLVYNGSPTLDRYAKYNQPKGMSAFASDLISFHHLTPNDIRIFEMLLYIVKIQNLNVVTP